MSTGLQIDWEVADKIALAVLVDHLKMLREEVRSHKEEGTWMHPEDFHDAEVKLIPALEVLIPYYGGTV